MVFNKALPLELMYFIIYIENIMKCTKNYYKKRYSISTQLIIYITGLFCLVTIILSLFFIYNFRQNIETRLSSLVITSTMLITAMFPLGLLTAIFLGTRITDPLKKLENITTKLSDGYLDVKISTDLLDAKNEIGSLSKALDTVFNNFNNKVQRMEGSKNVLEQINKDLKEKERELQQKEETFRTIFETSNDGILIIQDDRIYDSNKKAQTMFGINKEQLIGLSIEDLSTENQPDGKKSKIQWIFILHRVLEQGHLVFEWLCKRNNGSPFYVEISLNTLRIKDIKYIQAIIRDIDKRKKLEKELQNTQRLEAIGQLTAGIAHEINSPIHYISDNMAFIDNELTTIMPVAKEILKIQKKKNVTKNDINKLKEKLANIDIEFLSKELTKAVNENKKGLSEVSEMISAMKIYAHADNAHKLPIDINKTVNSIITVCKSEWKYITDIKTTFDPSMPIISCFVNDLQQAIMNIIINAVHAIEEQNEKIKRTKGQILIHTHLESDSILISIKDNGIGIPKKTYDKVFDPFFTTKQATQELGQGLAQAYTTIVDKHEGSLTFESEYGRGSTFFIRLPNR